MTLYELTEDWLRFLDLAEDPFADEDILRETLEELTENFADKVDAYGKVIRQLEADADAIKQEEMRLTQRRKNIENNIERIKDRLKESMIAIGEPKIKTELFSFSVQKNPPALRIDDESRITHDYLIPQPPKIDTKAIKQAIKEGFHFDWCHLEQSESLRIR